MTDTKTSGFSLRVLIFCAFFFVVGWIARGWCIPSPVVDKESPPIGNEEKKDNVKIDSPVEVSPPASLPPKLPEEAFIERYPVGKSIRGVGILNAAGRGSNTTWSIKGSANFNYLLQIPVKTQVIVSDTKHGRLVFEQEFGVTIQQLAISDQQLELVPPNNLLVRDFWPVADETLKLHPIYDKFRKAIDWINAADPALKRTLTTVNGWLKRAGVDLRPDDDVQFKVVVEKLAGCRFRIVYLSGIGVTSITPLNEERFDRAELIRLARSCNVLADYFVFPSLKRGKGEVWDVQASEVGNLFAFYDPAAELSGSVKLSRGDDEAGGSIARLEVQGGRVRIHSQVNGIDREGTFIVKEGTAWFDQDHRFVQRAHVTFSTSTLHRSSDHLLFGTENIRDLKLESHYSAEFDGSMQVAPETDHPER